MVRKILRSALMAATFVTAVTTQPATFRVPAAHAEQLDAAGAREAFRDAMTLEAAGDYAGALAKLQQVAAYKSTPQVRFNIGICQEKLGRLVVALGEYRIALADAQQDPSARKVVPEARRAIAALEPRIPTLTLTRGSGADAAEVTMDGRSVLQSQLDSPFAIDPGKHAVEANAQGYNKFHKDIDVKAGERASIEITLEKSGPIAVVPVPPVPSTSAAATPSAVPTAPTEPTEPAADAGAAEPATSEHSLTHTLGWVSLGVGVTGIIVASVFYAKRSSAISDLDSQCGPDKQSCPASAQSLVDSGRFDTLMGNVGLGIGLAGVLTGVVLLAVPSSSSTEPAKPAEPPKDPTMTSLHFSPWVGSGQAGAWLTGRF